MTASLYRGPNFQDLPWTVLCPPYGPIVDLSFWSWDDRAASMRLGAVNYRPGP
jgi:hypothetical protein